MPKLITVKGGKFGVFQAIVDCAAFKELSKYKWYLHDGYARRFVWKGSAVMMHRQILSASGNQICDHINGNRLDNRRANLRITDRLGNAQNSKKRHHNISGFKGVSWHEKLEKWRAQIQVNKKKMHIGVYRSVKAAAMAYDRKARECFGEFARLNFP